jgi:3-oxo-5-alpha-steroid 4-dehydrogenase 1
MESAGFITLLYIMYALPAELGIKELPYGNWTMAWCFVNLTQLRYMLAHG